MNTQDVMKMSLSIVTNTSTCLHLRLVLTELCVSCFVLPVAKRTDNLVEKSLSSLLIQTFAGVCW